MQLEIELNRLVQHMATTLFQVRGVYRYNIPIGTNGKQKNRTLSGLYISAFRLCTISV